MTITFVGGLDTIIMIYNLRSCTPILMYLACSSWYYNHVNPCKMIIMDIICKICISGQITPGWGKQIESICVRVYNGQILRNGNFSSI